jgi:(E)-4-hydroxy-3-methylbut-2-enyl-diphosphate synthase
MLRKKTKEIKIGDFSIGGKHPILIQSMTNTNTKEVQATIKQIKSLIDNNCNLVRVALEDQESVKAFKKIKDYFKNKIGLIADIHFDYQLAIEAIENGADKIRINPGNIKNKENLKKIIKKAKAYQIPIRIGVNAGSLESKILKKHKKPTAEALVYSALKNINFFEENNFKNLVVSLKHSDVAETIKAYSLMSEKTNYPLHLGVTEAGTFLSGTVKSSIAISNLFLKGVGDTFRVSLSADPLKEVEVGYKILEVLNLTKNKIEIISCPTCSRTAFEVVKTAQELEDYFKNKKVNKSFKIAVMGCLVNGPGEARAADIGISGLDKNSNQVMLFKKDKIIKQIKKDQIIEVIKKFVIK